jgi:arabinose-5-phosphate isomerase
MHTKTLLESLINVQKESLNYFYNHIDVELMQSVFEKMGHAKILYLTGVGKSAFIAKRIAQMLVSIGKRASFLSPLDALHGDLGILDANDSVVLFSKSGTTKELLELLPFLKKRGCQTLAICNKKESLLSTLSDWTLFLPLDRELCPFDLAPTTSSSIQMMFGDLFVVWMMEKNQFTLDEYAFNHPAGFIGKKLTLFVDDVMIKDLPLVTPYAPFSEMLDVLTSKLVGCVLVVDKDRRLLGIYTDGDLKRTLIQDRNFLEKKVEEVMTKNPKTVQTKTLAIEALRKMHFDPKKIVTHFPVLDEDRLIGLVRMQEIIAHGLVI